MDLLDMAQFFLLKKKYLSKFSLAMSSKKPHKF
jgi:hypothetical protein